MSGRDVGRELALEAVAQLADIEREVFVFVGKMLVEGGSAYHRALAQKIDRYIVEALFEQQLCQRVVQCEIGFFDSQVEFSFYLRQILSLLS